MSSQFFPSDTRPEVQSFVKAFKAKYNQEPGLFAAIAYDAIKIVAAAIKQAGPDRAGIHNALGQLKDVPSVIYGKVTFNANRRVSNLSQTKIVIKNGQFVVWNHKTLKFMLHLHRSNNQRPDHRQHLCAAGGWAGADLRRGAADQFRAWLGLYDRGVRRLGLHRPARLAAGGDICDRDYGMCAGWPADRALRAAFASGTATIAPLLATVGVSLVLDQGAQLVFGPQPNRFAARCPSGESRLAAPASARSIC